MAYHAPPYLGYICSAWFFQFRWLSICKPRNFVFTVSSIHLPVWPICNAECDEFFVMNLIIVSLSKLRTKLLAANHSIIWQRNGFDSEQKSSKFLLDVMTVVSLANIGYDIDFILRGKLFIHIMNNRGHTTDCWGTPRFNVP